MSTAEPLDPKRPWITDPDDLPANNNLLQTLFNPLGRSSKVPFTRVWTWMFFANLLLVPAIISTMFSARSVSFVLLGIYVFLMLIRLVVQTRRLADAVDLSLKDLVLYPNLILAPATILSLLVPWPGVGASWSFGLALLLVHAAITVFGYFIYPSVSNAPPRATYLAGLVLAPLLLAGAMFVYQANKGVTIANGVTAMQKLGQTAAKIQTNQGTGNSGASGRKAGAGGEAPKNMNPMDMVVGMAFLPTFAVWVVTSFGIMLWSLLWVARRPRRGASVRAL